MIYATIPHPISRYMPDNDLPNVPDLCPLDSAQARRASRMEVVIEPLWAPETPS